MKSDKIKAPLIKKKTAVSHHYIEKNCPTILIFSLYIIYIQVLYYLWLALNGISNSLVHRCFLTTLLSENCKLIMRCQTKFPRDTISVFFIFYFGHMLSPAAK